VLTYTEEAAVAIGGHNLRVIGGEPWDTLLAFVRNLVRQLLDGCAPTPQEGYDYLTEQYPWYRPFAAGRRDRAVRRAVRAAGGTDADAAKVWTAIESGKLSRDLMAGLYRECR
jgi:hypothetical protein